MISKITFFLAFATCVSTARYQNNWLTRYFYSEFGNHTDDELPPDVLSAVQLRELEASFRQDKFDDTPRRRELSKRLEVSEDRVRQWFKARRRRELVVSMTVDNSTENNHMKVPYRYLNLRSRKKIGRMQMESRESSSRSISAGTKASRMRIPNSRRYIDPRSRKRINRIKKIQARKSRKP